VGEDWDSAHAAAEESLAEADFLVHPHAQEDTWEGHASLVKEVADVLGRPPACLVAAVGGGGLALGLARGLDRQPGTSVHATWHQTRLLAVETKGAACLGESLTLGKRVRLDKLETCASSLAIRSIIPELLEYMAERPSRVRALSVTDEEALNAVVSFADDERQLVEPACGAALAAVYSGQVRQLEEEGYLGEGPVVVVVCGGNLVSTAMVESWRAETLLNPYLAEGQTEGEQPIYYR